MGNPAVTALHSDVSPGCDHKVRKARPRRGLLNLITPTPPQPPPLPLLSQHAGSDHRSHLSKRARIDSRFMFMGHPFFVTFQPFSFISPASILDSLAFSFFGFISGFVYPPKTDSYPLFQCYRPFSSSVTLPSQVSN